MVKLPPIILFTIVLASLNCQTGVENTTSKEAKAENSGFAEDVLFLSNHTVVLILKSTDSPGLIAVAGALQGRVMTSSATGMSGRSYGWINRALFESGDTLEHINAFGGEERFWLGPEGGQYSIFFAKDDPFDLNHWQTPRLIDLEPFELKESNEQSAVFEKHATLSNYSGFNFNIHIERVIEILSSQAIRDNLGLTIDMDIPVVGYQTTNELTNTGTQDWSEETGLLSIWLLGMYNPSEATTIIIPFQENQEAIPGPVVNDSYFGTVPSDRLRIKDGVIYFKGDGQYRSKIGLAPERAKNICGAYDAENKILTIVKYNKPNGVDKYVNSLWEIQDEPYRGDVINSYNDGPPEPGKDPLGPFYELETSSPALSLKTGETGVHIQETYHFEGDEKKLDQITTHLLGVSIEDITAVFQ